MTTTLTKFGDQWALVFDEAMLESANIGPETPLEITANGKGFSITPAVEYLSDDKFKEALGTVNAQFGGVLKRLAE